MGVLLFKGDVGVGMLKWQTSGFPLRAGGTLRRGLPSAFMCEVYAVNLR
jgi:hypothetical protein